MYYNLKIEKKYFYAQYISTKYCIGNNFKKVHEWKIYPLKKKLVINWQKAN